MELIIIAFLGLALGALESWASALGTEPSNPRDRDERTSMRLPMRASRETARSDRLIDLATRREHRAHSGRVERLSAHRASAEAAGDQGSASRFSRLLSLENARHREKLHRLARNA